MVEDAIGINEGTVFKITKIAKVDHVFKNNMDLCNWLSNEDCINQSLQENAKFLPVLLPNGKYECKNC